jgi:hypothetical protein
LDTQRSDERRRRAEAARKRRTVLVDDHPYYEVKTSLGDGGQIELGESQVRAAQRNAKNEQWRLIVITNVLNENRRLHVLRNPFHEKSRGLYTFVGQGLRLRYQFS